MSEQPFHLRAEELARAISRLPDPETGPPIVRQQVEPFRLLAYPMGALDRETAEVHFVQFRREAFGRGRERWHEYVLDTTSLPR